MGISIRKLLPKQNSLLIAGVILCGAIASNVAHAENSSVSNLIIDQQKNEVTGVVSDDAGVPLPGVLVAIAGTTTGTVTGGDGEYSIDIATGQTLVYSFIGYKTQEVVIGTETLKNIKLEVETLVGDEVVVVGYGTQRKVNLSGAVATLPIETLENRPVITVGQALQGAVANMNVTITGGQANETPKVKIRGTTSLNEGSPLVVIDGIISDATKLNRMNPNDIASFSILKDAASSAIYGSRAAFGVILVTTKKGRSEDLVINYNNNFALRKLTSAQEIITDPYTVLTTKDVMKAGWYSPSSEEILAYAKKVSDDPSTSPYYVNPDGTYTYFGNTDWVNESYKEFGMSTMHNVDLSGGTERINYYFSAGYNYQGGMLKLGSDNYNRYNLRSKLDFKLTDWWSLSNNTSYTASDYKSANYVGSSFYRQAQRSSPLDVPKNPDGTWTYKGAELMGNLTEGGDWVQDLSDMSTQFNTKMDIIKDVLSIQGNFAYSSSDDRYNGATLPIAWYEGVDKPANYLNATSNGFAHSTNTSHVLFDAFANFNKTFNKKHAITVLAGFNQEEYRKDYTRMDRKELITSSIPTPGLAVGDITIDHAINTWALRGAFARFNYTFDDKYIVEFNGRYDGTSRFPTDSRYVFSPSGSVAWIISKEKFFEPIQDVMNFMKIRGSYGTLGNQSVGDYAYLATMGSGTSGYIINGDKPVYVSAPGLVSAALTWEMVTTTNIGLDMSFFDNKLTFSGDAYIRETKDMLTAGPTLPGVLGTGEPEMNAADLETKGWEITLGWRDVVQVAGKDLRYNIGFNLADSRSWITRFDNPNGNLSDYYDGYELGQIWGLETDGFFTSQADIDGHADQKQVTSYIGTRPLAPGDLKFKDQNGDGEINDGKWTTDDHGDYKIIGNTRSRFTFGLTGSFDWNGFDLSVFLQGVGKRDYWPGTDDFDFWGVYSQPWANITVGNHTDRWTEDTPNGYYPRYKSYVAESSSYEAGVKQTRYLQDASYVRLKNITFGYTLPSRVTKKINIDRLRVYFSADNLGEVSNLYENYNVDPDMVGDRGYPLQRNFSLGINLTL